MKTLKFGGSSAANAPDLLKCVSIIQNKAKESKVIVVISALANTTDLLLQAAEQAANKDEQYIDVFQQIESHHINMIKSLIPIEE